MSQSFAAVEPLSPCKSRAQSSRVSPPGFNAQAAAAGRTEPELLGTTNTHPIAIPKKPFEDDKQNAIDWLLSINLSPPNNGLPRKLQEKPMKTRFQSARPATAPALPTPKQGATKADTLLEPASPRDQTPVLLPSTSPTTRAAEFRQPVLKTSATEANAVEESNKAGVAGQSDAENSADVNNSGSRHLFFPSACSSPISVFSLLPYVLRLDSKHSTSTSTSSGTVGVVDNVDGDDATPLRRQHNNNYSLANPEQRASLDAQLSSLGETKKPQSKPASSGEPAPYDPELLDDPLLMEGKHRKLFDFGVMRVSFVHYVSQRERKEEMNEQFKARHPGIVKRQQLTLTRIRKLKRLMRQSFFNTNIPTSDTLETIAVSLVIFEKLIFCEAVFAEDRRAYAAACVLVSAKLTLDACLSKSFTRRFLVDLSRIFHIQVDRIIFFEAQICVRSDITFIAAPSEVNPHLERLRELLATDTF